VIRLLLHASTRPYSLADVSLTPTIVRMEDLGRVAMWHDLPRVADWYARIQARRISSWLRCQVRATSGRTGEVGHARSPFLYLPICK
jgi:hypothetical protein